MKVTREIEQVTWRGRDTYASAITTKTEELHRSDLTWNSAEEIELAMKLWWYWGAIHGCLYIHEDVYPIWFVRFVMKQCTWYQHARTFRNVAASPNRV